MLLTADFIQRGVNVLAEKFAPKKSNFSAKHTIKKTVKTTDGMIIAILALLILLMEICLIVFHSVILICIYLTAVNSTKPVK